MASLDLATLSVRIEADSTGAVTGINQVGQASQQQSQKVQTDWNKVGKDLTSIGKKLSLAVSLPIIAAGTACVKLASDLTETLGKTEVVFGDMSDSVISWSETSIDSMGLSQQTALDMASTYGDLGTSMGLTTGEAMNMSTNLVQLAADMASFKNISIERANSALTAIYTGETESLKALGVVMTEANLETFAMNEGIGKTYKEMSQTEKVMLRYKYVMQQTSNAQGDFKRTGDSLANQSRKLGENVKQLGASFGQILEPAVAGVVSTINKVVTWLNSLDEGTKRTILTIAEIAAAIPIVVLAIGTITTAVTALQAKLTILMANPIILAITAVTAAVVGLGIAIANANTEIDRTTDSYISAKNRIENNPLKPTVDTSGLTSVEIEISADTQAVIDSAKSVIATLKSDYSGEIAIDGDTKKADEALTALENAINDAEAFMKIGGTPDEAEQVRLNLLSAINGTKGIVGIGANADVANAMLAQLREDANNLAWTVSISPDEYFEANLQALKDKLAPFDNKEYKAIGMFELGEGLAEGEALSEYVEAIAGATIAVEGFDDAVGNLDALTERAKAEKVAAVNAQTTAMMYDLLAMKQAGLITPEEYTARSTQIAQAAQIEIKAINQQADAQKEFNATFSDGVVDVERMGEVFESTVGAVELSADRYAAAAEEVVNIDLSTENLTAYKEEAILAWQDVTNETQRSNAAMIAANEEYSSSLSTIDKAQETTITTLKQESEYAQNVADAFDIMGANTQAGVSAAEALNVTIARFPTVASTMVEELDAQVESLNPQSEAALEAAASDTEFAAALDVVTTSMGNGATATEALTEAMKLYPEQSFALVQACDVQWQAMQVGYAETLEALLTYDQISSDKLKDIETANADFETQRTTANDKFISDMLAAESRYTADDVAEIASRCQQIGVELDGNIVDNTIKGAAAQTAMANAIRDGSPKVVGEVQATLAECAKEKTTAESGGMNTGEAAIEGMINGMENKSGALYNKAAAIVATAIQRMKQEADVNSPSKKTRDLIGKPLMEGVEVGMDEYLPKVVKTARASIDTIITSGTSAVPRVNTPIAKTANTKGNTTINQTNNFTSRTLSPFEQQQQIHRLNKDLSGVFA